MLKIVKKLHNGYKRLRLGARFKHQYNCHPAFNLIRDENACRLTWQGKAIAQIPYAHTAPKAKHGACFVVASGPSLAEVDLNMLAGLPTISLNCAIKKFTDQGLAPSHCIMVDHRVFERQWACVEASILSGTHCFFSFEGLSIIAERAPDLFRHGNIFLIESISRKFGIPRLNPQECLTAFSSLPMVYWDNNLPQYVRSIGFSGMLQHGVFSGKTVATWAVQLAFGLGYQSIFMVGMDLGGTGKAHFYADQHNPSPDFLRYYEPHIRACFEQAKRACDQHGVKLYNLSMHSALPDDIVPKIPLADAVTLAGTYSTQFS